MHKVARAANICLKSQVLGNKRGGGVADGIRTRNNRLHKPGLYH